MLPLLKLTGDGEQHTLAEAVERLARSFGSRRTIERSFCGAARHGCTTASAWTTTYLRKAGLLQGVGPGRFRITTVGATCSPAAQTIDVAFLESRFPEMPEFRKGVRKARSRAMRSRPPPSTRPTGPGTSVQASKTGSARSSKRSIPNEGTAARRSGSSRSRSRTQTRSAATPGSSGRPSTGCAHDRPASRLRGHKVEDASQRHRADRGRGPGGARSGGRDDEAEFKKVPGGVLLTFPVEHAGEALDLLQDGLDSFVDLAMARVRRRVSLEDHAPEAVSYVAGVVGRELPQPEPVVVTREDPNSSMTPRTRTMSARPESHGSAGGRRSSSTASARLPP